MSTFRDRYLQLIAGQGRGLLPDMARGLLRLLSLGYRVVIAARNAWYDWAPRAARRVPCPVISVGNITVGGTGKTPTAARIAHLLLQRNLKVAVLLRGYKGRPIQFDEETRQWAQVHWRQEGDEAMVLKRRCPRAMVVVNPDRVAGARRAVRRGVQAIVLDDAFQHRRIARDLDIVLVDATAPFGHGYLLPRGLLREPTRALRRADLIILTRADQVDAAQRILLLRKLAKLSGEKPVLSARHRVLGFTDVKGAAVSVADPSAMQAVIFAGIANFESYRKTVEGLGVRILAAYEYPDHHDYTTEEIAALNDVVATLEANVLLTTEKDAVKLVGRWPESACRLLVVQLDIELDGEGDKILVQAIDAALAGFRGRDDAGAARSALAGDQHER